MIQNALQNAQQPFVKNANYFVALRYQQATHLLQGCNRERKTGRERETNRERKRDIKQKERKGEGERKRERYRE